MELVEDGMCFACGKLNASGLRLQFSFRPHEARTTFVPGKIHQGYSGIMHGGIMSTLLDEAMAWAALNMGLQVLTAELTVRFKKPVRIGDEIRIIGRLKDSHGKIVHAEAEARDSDDAILATATARLVRV